MKRKGSGEEAREILRNGVLDMSVMRLTQIAELGLCGTITTMIGCAETIHYYNCMEYIKAENKNEYNWIHFMFAANDKVVASTKILIDEIEDISGSIDEENPESVLDVTIFLIDLTEIQVKIFY